MSDMAAADVADSDDVVRPSVGRWYRLRDYTAVWCERIDYASRFVLVSYPVSACHSKVKEVTVYPSGHAYNGVVKRPGDVVREVVHPPLKHRAFADDRVGSSLSAMEFANLYHISAVPLRLHGEMGWFPTVCDTRVNGDWIIDNMPSPHGWLTWADAVNSLGVHIRSHNGRTDSLVS